ncbi:MAG: helix-turn-helix domain-containing protein [Alphaproteobacteria bacterium]
MLIRMSSKLSQSDLGKKIGVKAQQIHKYETGENRLSAESVQKCSFSSS